MHSSHDASVAQPEHRVCSLVDGRWTRPRGSTFNLPSVRQARYPTGVRKCEKHSDPECPGCADCDWPFVFWILAFLVMLGIWAWGK